MRYSQDDMKSKFDGNHAAEEWARSIWGHRVFDLNEEIRELKAKLRKFESDEQKAADFDRLIKAIKENPAVSREWDRIMMILKMTY